MALLDNCFFCSLSVAASVIGVYTLVAYVIAFFLETWWIVSTPVAMPSPAYVLCAGYLVVSVFTGVLLRGLSVKKTVFLLEWLLVVAVVSVPEGVLVYFMSIHYWNIRSLYGLMELTCWICRAIVNVSGMICVQSLYSNWREEKEVKRRLRDLNMTRVIPNRRNSVTSQANGYVKSPPTDPSVYSGQTQVLNNGAYVPTLRRTGSMLSVVSMTRSQTPDPAMFLGPPPSPGALGPVGPLGAPHNPYLTFKTCEFNASQFDQCLMGQGVGPAATVSKAHSLIDLRHAESELGANAPRKTMSVVDFPQEKPRLALQTQSLDRRLLRPAHSNVESFYIPNRLKNAYFPPPRNGEFAMHPAQLRDIVYGRNINSFYQRKPTSRSKHSVGSDSDDFQKYRDIAL